MSTIQPRTLKGFRDFLPSQMRVRQHVFSIFRTVFEKFGYEPLETPTLEYADILKGKYGEEAEQLKYHFTDRGGREVAMRYDVTVPACRVMAQYQNDLPLPFKRYQIQPVWRAENTQKGRQREFYQCDADTFGSSSQIVEAEYIQMGIEALVMLGFQDIDVRINNRKIINAMVEYAGASSEFYTVCIAIDKLDKIGIEGVQEELRKKLIGDSVIEKITQMLSIPPEDSLKELEKLIGHLPQAQEGIKEIRNLFSFLETAKVPEEYYRFDLAIIRGLSYYTGPVFEIAIRDGGVGSVGGGGRYDELVKLYSGQDIPAAGGSFGIERIIEIITDRQLVAEQGGVSIMIAPVDESAMSASISVAAGLRNNGKNVLLYPEAGAKLQKQLKYADKKKIRYVILIGENEVAGQMVKIKDMSTGEEKEIKTDQLASFAF